MDLGDSGLGCCFGGTVRGDRIGLRGLVVADRAPGEDGVAGDVNESDSVISKDFGEVRWSHGSADPIPLLEGCIDDQVGLESIHNVLRLPLIANVEMERLGLGGSRRSRKIGGRDLVAAHRGAMDELAAQISAPADDENPHATASYLLLARALNAEALDSVVNDREEVAVTGGA